MSLPAPSMTRGDAPHVRWRWRVAGQVQGVGFRPFVYRLATDLHLSGLVRNAADGVVIEAQGDDAAVECFDQRLRRDAPPAARIRSIEREPLLPRDDLQAFTIHPSTRAAAPTAAVTPDLAVCEDCLAEIRDPANPRRAGYALVNCTACGPRYSIVRAVPYDRCNTTMAGFALCDDCRREYADPLDRRFHAQPTACHACGPQLELLDADGAPLAGHPIHEAARRLLAGQIIAIKGIGGYHIAARADDADAIGRLRALKHRPAKPLALMAATLEHARRLIHLTATAAILLCAPEAPIVLARRRTDAPVADAVAPGTHRLGVMLAYTPLHHLLFDAMGDAPPALVMTSANDSDQPLVHRDADAPVELGGLCDALLRHNRPIERPVDDSVLIDTGARPILLRRARGYAPAAIPIPATPAARGLALGAELKNTVAVLRNGEAILSQHLGDLTHTATHRLFTRATDDLLALFDVTPAWVAHDLHPMYLSTAHARACERRWNVPLVGVQHHHAHAAAVLAEHGLRGPALAVICDGTGYGTDGTIWGGELLLANLTSFRRLAHLCPLRLPGGDAAAKQPWRSALALLFNVLGSGFADHPVAAALAGEQERRFVAAMIDGQHGCVASSSTGRLFDAVAALLGLCHENRFDAEAPMALEAAAEHAPDGDYAAMVRQEALAGWRDDGQLDVAPLIRRLLLEQQRGADVGVLAALFHAGLAELFATAVKSAAQSSGVERVVLGGGVMCNARLVDALTRQLEESGLRVLLPQAAPPNDGGIALGQLAVAAARMEQAT